MGDSQGNPFIDNPFMQGASKKQRSEPPVSQREQSEPLLETAEPKLLETPPSPKKTRSSPRSRKSAPSTPKPSPAKKPAVNPQARTRKTNTSPPPTSTISHVNNGYRVQVLAKIPMPTSTNMPGRDYLWFAIYPIIPRVGDCIFHDGRYFRVDAVFLYENTNAGWCADLEVSYYTRRH